MKSFPFIRLALLWLALLCSALAASAQTTVRTVGADERAYSRIATNTWLARPIDKPLKLYDITVNNISGTDYYVMIFDQTATPVAGDYPMYTSAKVTAGLDRSYFFTGGCVFTNGLWIAASTTPVTFTNTASMVFTIGVSYDKNIR